jgi:hypothetical protein
VPRQSAIGPEFRHDAAIYGATYHHDSPCARHRAPERAGPVYSARHWPRSPEARRAKPLLRLSVVRRSPAPVSYLAGTAFAKRRSNEPSLFGTPCQEHKQDCNKLPPSYKRASDLRPSARHLGPARLMYLICTRCRTSRVSGTASPNSRPAITNSGLVRRYVAEPLSTKLRAARDGVGAFDP